MVQLSLERLGLARNEAKTYLALLNLGSSTAGQLSKKTGLHRSNVYDALRKLVEKGMVSYIMSSGRKCFEAASPNRVLGVIEEKKAQNQELEKIAMSLIPSLLKVKDFSNNRQQVTVYEGLEGVKTVFELILKSTKTNRVLGAYSKPYILKYFLEQWHRRRVKAKVTDLMLFKSSGIKRAKQFANMSFTEVRILPATAGSPLAINIFSGKVAFIIGLPEAPIGIVIDNKRIYADFKDYFDALWRCSAPLS